MTGNWSAAARSVWGKTSSYDADASMPLVQHLCDSADIAIKVWSWLPLRTRTLVEQSLPEGGREGSVLLAWLAGVHDIGKATCPFASKVPVLADRMRDAGLALYRDPTDFRHAPHGLAGQVVLSRWLKAHYSPSPAVTRTYAVVVGGHHGVPPASADLSWMRSHAHMLGDQAWVDVQDEILDEMATRTGAEEYLASWCTQPLPVTVQAVLTGAVIVADWLASNVELFPFEVVAGKDRAQFAWESVRLPTGWLPEQPPTDPGEHLRRRFPLLSGQPRPVQRAAVNAARSADSAPLMIVESSMGSGKTEAALLAAEILAARFDCNGLFFGLPTMATSDGMFRRVLDWINTFDAGAVTSIFLAHGKAGLNDDFRGLMPGRYAEIHDESEKHGSAEAVAWLSGRKKGVLSSMVVGTVDQLLFLALQAKHAALRHLALAGKVVVVDEVHAADDFMRMYLCRALEWLAAYGVPVVLLSATLPTGQRAELIDAYRLGLGLPAASVGGEAGYPLVTTVTGAGVQAETPVDHAGDVEVEVRAWSGDDEALVVLLEDLLAGGGCAAVVRNTVGRAQQTSEALRSRWGDQVALHHSRFLSTHRAADEGGLRDALGPPAREDVRPTRRIVVGTQVLEQSLDIDFDVMITDLAPVDLVLQRIGRLHRHPRPRPGRLATPTAYVAGVERWESDGPVLDRGGRAVYGERNLLRSAAVLRLHEGGRKIAVPGEIRDLVEAAYAPSFDPPSGWSTRLGEAETRHRDRVAGARRRADTFRIGSIDDLVQDHDGSLVGWLEHSSAEAEDSRSQGSARVRDGDESIEVVVAQVVDGQVRHVDDGSRLAGNATPDIGPPSNDLARALAGCTVRLPPMMTASGADFDRVVGALERRGIEGWQDSPWLKGQLPLLLDEHWRTSLAGFQIMYDRQRGLVVTREDDA